MRRELHEQRKKHGLALSLAPKGHKTAATLITVKRGV